MSFRAEYKNAHLRVRRISAQAVVHGFLALAKQGAKTTNTGKARRHITADM
jgi:hypothetical protein